jgi:hypothetical protein
MASAVSFGLTAFRFARGRHCPCVSDKDSKGKRTRWCRSWWQISPLRVMVKSSQWKMKETSSNFQCVNFTTLIIFHVFCVGRWKLGTEPYIFTDVPILQCVHKVHSGFWKIVARKQIERATCGLRQITAKLWKRSSTCGFCRASYKRCTDCFHTFIAHTRSATSLAIMDARKRRCQSLIA